MPKSCCADCLGFMFCTPCMICQDNKELKAGFGLPPNTEYYAGTAPAQGNEMQQNLMQGQYQQPQGYQQPPQGYQQPPQGYQAPPQGYQAPPQGYAAPPSQTPYNQDQK